MSETSPDSPDYDEAKASFGFPGFAGAFPRHPELDALVVAYARGDYATVRAKAPDLAKSDDADVARAAKVLRERVEADPGAKLLFLFTAVLLAFLTVWWVGHDGPEHGKPAPTPAPKIEYVK